MTELISSSQGPDLPAVSLDDKRRFEDVISGHFDAESEGEGSMEQGAIEKRVLLPQPESPKLHKVLAQAGVGSRLEMEQLILEGRISVNNEPAHIGQRVQFGDQVKVNGRPIRFRIQAPAPRVIAYHKPAGEVVTHDDPQNRPTVFRRLPKLFQGKWQSVGRLDLNTEGLLLFTSSGELANNLMHPRFGLEREYAVRVLGALTTEEKQRLLSGVNIGDGPAHFGAIEAGGGEGSNCWYRVTISEGRNREVRRMFEVVGHAVSRLIRIRYGSMVLPRGLKRGTWMELDASDIDLLTRASRTAFVNTGMPTDGVRPPAGGSSGAAQGPKRDASPGKRPGRGRAGPRPGGMPGAGVPDPLASGQTPGSRVRSAPSNQPDPMKTSLGYIGADSYSRQRLEAGKRRLGGGAAGGRKPPGRSR
jgi:23S rRNA pseudouridine2605 synthase